jgi:hypothetical protein
MRDKSDNPASFIKMEQARSLQDQGRYQESLMLALEALLQELENLRDSLLSLRTGTRSEWSAPASGLQEELPPPEPFWLPVVKPRVLH